MHEALHGNNIKMRMNGFQRIWNGTNAWDKAAIGGGAVAIAYSSLD